MVTLVDTDSYHIVERTDDVPLRGWTGDYIPPELQKRLYGGQSLSSMPLPTYSKETDRFALAVNLFSLFMNGCHPFACAIDPEEADMMDESLDIPQPSDNIRKGFLRFSTRKRELHIRHMRRTLHSCRRVFRDCSTGHLWMVTRSYRACQRQ